MKKKMFIIVTLALTFSMLLPQAALVASAADTIGWVQLGDVDLDGSVTTEDALIVAKYVGRVLPMPANNTKAFKAANVDHPDANGVPHPDNEITAADVRIILRAAAGTITLNSGVNPNSQPMSKQEIAEIFNTYAKKVKTPRIVQIPNSQDRKFSNVAFDYTDSNKVTNVTAVVDYSPSLTWLQQIPVAPLKLLIEGQLETMVKEMKATPEAKTSRSISKTDVWETLNIWFPIEGIAEAMDMNAGMLKSATNSLVNNELTLNAVLNNETISLKPGTVPDAFTQTNHGRIFLIPDEDSMGEVGSLLNTDGITLKDFNVKYTDSSVKYVIDTNPANEGDRLKTATYTQNYTLSITLDMMDKLIITLSISSRVVQNMTFKY